MPVSSQPFRFENDREVNRATALSQGLTMGQHGTAFCVDMKGRRRWFMLENGTFPTWMLDPGDAACNGSGVQNWLGKTGPTAGIWAIVDIAGANSSSLLAPVWLFAMRHCAWLKLLAAQREDDSVGGPEEVPASEPPRRGTKADRGEGS